MPKPPDMHVFVYEYLSSGATVDASSRPSLQTEGWAMLAAMLDDLARSPGMRISTLIDRQRVVPPQWSICVNALRVQPASEKDAFHELAATADWSLLIAPEFDGILAERSRWVEEAGGRLLGSSPQAIHQTADKLLLSRLWSETDVPTALPDMSYPLVCKPRFGAGSQATFLVHNHEALVRAVFQSREEGWTGELMFQRYATGLPVSVAFIGNGKKSHSLPAVEQRLSGDGRFRYLGGRLPLPGPLDRRARALAERAVACVEGLRGWYGVDLILGEATDGSEDLAIEVNPRLTTSYLGLRRLARFNLAEDLLAVVAGLSTPSWKWRADTLVFDANG